MAQVSFMDALKGAQSATTATPVPAAANLLAALAKAPPPAKTVSTDEAPARPDWGTAGNALAAGLVRPAITAATALPGMAADAVSALPQFDRWAHAKLFGAPLPQNSPLPTQALGNLVDRYVPKSRGLGKVAETVDSLLVPQADLGNVIGLAKNVPGNFVAGVSNDADKALAWLKARNLGNVPAGALTRAQSGAAAQGKKLGMQLTPGQATGSKPLQQIETWAESHPWTSGPFNRLRAANQSALNRVAAASIGEKSPVVDANTMGDAANRTGDVFNAIRSSDVRLPVDPAATQDFLRGLNEENEGLLPNDAAVTDHPLVKTLQGIMQRASGRAGNSDAFMKDVEGASTQAADNPAARRIGNASFELTHDPFDANTLHLADLSADQPGKGEGSKALARITDLADRHGVTLTLDAHPTGPNAMPLPKLVQVYGRHGFMPQGDDETFMVRTPQVTAKQLGQLSSKLGRAAYKQMTGQNGDRDLGKALYAVKDHVDDLVQQNLTGEGKTAYANARGQYRNLMHLTSRGNIVNPSTGNVNGVALASRLQQADRPGFLFGRNTSPLYGAARFAQAFKPLVGDSGTATRMANPFDPLELALGIPANLAARAYLSPLGRAAAAGALKAATKGANLGVRGLRGLALNPTTYAMGSR